MELELASTQELIEELSKRTTFVGMIIWSPDEHRVPGQCHDDFRMFTSINTDGTLKILEDAKASVEKKT